MRNFHVITNVSKDKDRIQTNRIRDYLTEKGCICTVQDLIRGEEGVEATISDETECAISLGGDGTLIQVAGMIKGRVPIIGVNLGTLGFLSESSADGVEEMLDRLLSDDYEIENRMMLSGTVNSEGMIKKEGCALNDIVITRTGSLRIVTFDIYVKGKLLNKYSADGIIISTPTGSTGYNLSAGGPIVEPDSKVILITPICPHTLNSRSIVLSGEDEICVKIGQGGHRGDAMSAVSFDGGDERGLLPGDEVVINRSGVVTKIVRLHKESFVNAVSRKLMQF